MLRTIVCIIGAANALQINEQLSVAEMIQGAIHAQTEARNPLNAKHSDASTIVMPEAEQESPAVDALANKLATVDGDTIKKLLIAENAGVGSDALTQGLLGGALNKDIAKEIKNDGGLANFMQTGVTTKTDQGSNLANSFLHKVAK